LFERYDRRRSRSAGRLVLAQLIARDHPFQIRFALRHWRQPSNFAQNGDEPAARVCDRTIARRWMPGVTISRRLK